MSRNHYSHSQPSAPPSPRAPVPAPAPVPRKRSYVTRYEREIEREQQEGYEVASASTFGENGVIGVWKIGREIGKGASGRVRIARNRQSKMLAAMKVIDKNGPPRESVYSMATSGGATGAAAIGNGEFSDDKIKISIDREVEIMKLIQHPNILQLYDVHESTDCIHLLLEYVGGGELFDRLVNLGRLGADEASQYFQQIISGVSYCHHFNIAHRDLKPENLLIDAHNRVKVADFGLAALQQPGRLLQTSCGSPHYASPEIVSGVEYNGAATDIWSCGVILYALVAGRLPFDDENPRTLLQKVKIGRYHMPADFEPDVKDLISKMLVLDPRRRIKMDDIIKHPFCRRRHPDFPPDSLFLLPPPDIATMRQELASQNGLDKSALRRLMVILPEISENDLIEALFADEETYAQVCYRLIIEYDNRKINDDDPAKYRFFGKTLNRIEKPREMDLSESIFARHPCAFGFGHGYDDYDYGYGYGFGYDLYGDAEHLQDHERIGADQYQHERERTGTSMGRRGDETPRPRRVRIPSPDADWELVHKAAAGTPILVDHDRVPSHNQTQTQTQTQTQAEAARALKRRSSHQPATSSRPAAPELHRRSTVIHTHNKETTQERERERERRVNGPRSPMPKTPAMPSHNDHYNTPLRTPQPMRSPQTPGATWQDYNVTPRAGGLAPPMADVLRWAAEVPLPVTPATPGSGFPRQASNGQGYQERMGTAQIQRRAESPPRRHAYATATAPPSPRSHTPTNLVVNRTPGRSKSRDRSSAVVDQEFLEHVQKLTVLHSELESPPFSKLSSSTIRNLDRLGMSTSVSGLPRRRGSPLPAPMPLGKGSPGSGPGRTGKMPNVFRMMNNKENQPLPGAEPVLRRKRSVFGTNKEKDKDKDKDKENRNSTYGHGHSTLPIPSNLADRKPVYASTFATPLDTKFGQNVPGGMENGNRKPRPAPLNLSVLPKHDLEPSPRLQTPQLTASPADTPMMSQLTTPTIGYHTAPRTPLAVVPEAQAKRNWFEKTFSGRPLGYYELISTYDCSTTREECFKIFTSLGAAVQIEDSENWGNLVITQHEVRGVTGQMITRPVKIKLVFIPRSISSFAPSPIPGSGRASPRPPPSPRSQYSSVRGGGVGGDSGTGTRITFRQEKGSEEGFMAVFEQFRTTWGLDSLRSPGLYGSPAFHSPNLSPINQKGRIEEHGHGLFEEDMTGPGMGMYDRT